MSADHLQRPWIDAALHLLDRQVVDREGLLVCKVDDLEISFTDTEQPPAVTRILTGPAALVPRLSTRTGHWLRRRWISLGVQYADRDVPLAIPLAAIDRLGSAVELAVDREGLLDRQPEAPAGVTLHRMGELIGMRVVGPDHIGGTVLDVRLTPARDRYVLDQLLVGPGRPGSLLGYDRGDFDGPWLVRHAVEWIHRHVVRVSVGEVEHFDWERGVLRLVEEAHGHPVSLD